MKQTGKFHVYEIKDDKRVVSAIANATLYFLDVNNQEQFKLIVNTDNEGNFNFDLAISEYVVLATAGDGLEQILANGSTFILTDQSEQNAFEQWINEPAPDTDSALLAKFREIMQRTETASESIKNTEDQLREDISKKWDKEEGTTALAKKQDVLEFVGEGKVMKEGAGGFLKQGIEYWGIDNANQFVHYNQDSLGRPRYHGGIRFANPYGANSKDDFCEFLLNEPHQIPVLFYKRRGAEIIHRFYTTQNTAVDSNGFIKNASPVINLYTNHIEHNDQFDEEPIFEKLGIGHYKISNTLGLAKGIEAGDWYIETPKNKNGERYFNTEWEQLSDNTVIIRTYEREAFTEEYERYDENGEVLKDPNGNPLKFYKRHEINGEPIDITENRFISLRFYEEPKQHEAPEIAEESEEDRKAREEQQALEAREQEIAELKRNRTLKSNEALVMKDIDESVYLELIEEVKEINARLKIVQ